MDKKLIGIDLGGTSVKIAILSLDGQIEQLWSIPTNIADEGAYIVSEIISSIQETLLENKLTANDILGIGMGSPGQIDYQKGTVTGAYNLGWATEQEIQSRFEKTFGVPFFIDNDANVAALGERWKGAGENARDVIFVTLGTGVGGGIIANGHLLHGKAGSAGEIGHMPILGNPFSCTCGNVGCLETVASATGIVNIALNRYDLVETATSLADKIEAQKLSAKDIFDAAKENDRFAYEVVAIFANYLGLSLAQLGNALNPDYIVIGGGVSAAGRFLLDKVTAEFEKYAFPTVRTSTHLKLASLGNEAGVIGAASLVL